MNLSLEALTNYNILIKVISSNPLKDRVKFVNQFKSDIAELFSNDDMYNNSRKIFIDDNVFSLIRQLQNFKAELSDEDFFGDEALRYNTLEEYSVYCLKDTHLITLHRDYYNKFLFDNYGGPATVKSYGSFENILRIHGDFYKNLKFYYLTDKYLFVHAGINPNYSLEAQEETDLVYIRGAFIYHKHNLPQKIIFGHTEFDKPYVDEGKIGIDLGCGKYINARLCGLILDEDGSEEFVYSD